jgi:MFS family permease
LTYWRRNLYILWFGCFFSTTCYTLVTPFLPLFLQQLHVEKGVETWAGFALASSFFTSCIVSPIWGSLADRFGRKSMIIRAGLGMGICYSLQFFVVNPLQLIGLRTLNGLFSGFVPAAQALVATNTPEDEIGSSLGIVQTASASGSIMGPLIGGVMAKYLGYRWTFMTAGLVLLADTIIVLLLVKEVAPRKPESRVHVIEDLREALANPALRIVLMCMAMTNAAMNILQPVLSLQVVRLSGEGTSTIAAGVVFSMAGIATVLGAPFWAKQGRRIGYKSVMVLGLFGAALINIPQAFVKSLILFGGLRFLVGLATSGVNLSINALTAKTVSRDFRGRAFGILQSFNQLGGMMGPVAGGVVGTAFGLEATFVLTAAVFGISGLATMKTLPQDRGSREQTP